MLFDDAYYQCMLINESRAVFYDKDDKRLQICNIARSQFDGVECSIILVTNKHRAIAMMETDFIA